MGASQLGGWMTLHPPQVQAPAPALGLSTKAVAGPKPAGHAAVVDEGIGRNATGVHPLGVTRHGPLHGPVSGGPASGTVASASVPPSADVASTVAAPSLSIGPPAPPSAPIRSASVRSGGLFPGGLVASTGVP